MELGALRSGLRAAIASFRQPAQRRIPLLQQQSRRLASTTTQEPLGDIRAAPPIDFGNTNARPADEAADEDDMEGGRSTASYAAMMSRLRIIPASPSYFTGKPDFTDDLLNLENLLRKYQTLPVLPTGQAPRIAWKTLAQYKVGSNEPVKAARYTKILQVLQRLNYIHPNLMPDEVRFALQRYMRDVQPFHNQPKPGIIDQYGRARGVGRRKSSNAVAYLVEGEGEVLVNGKPLTQAFGRLHDRESALWALKVTERMDKYNVWCVARGGGTTGQADAIALAVSKALMVHEPLLKPALRRGKLSPVVIWYSNADSESQPVWSQEILVVSRERSPESSRLARCLPGSSVDCTITPFLLYTVYLYKTFLPLVESSSPSTSLIRTLGSLLLRLLAKLPPRQLFQPTLLPLHLANLKVVLARLTLEHAAPPVNRILHPLLGQPRLPLPPLFEFCLLNPLPSSFPLQLPTLSLFIVDRYIRLLGSTDIRCQVFLETAGDESTRGITAGEKVVAAAGTVDVAAGRDVVDGAVQCNVDGFQRVAAIVGF